MQLNSNNHFKNNLDNLNSLNLKNRLNGHPLFFYNFKSFTTNSMQTSLTMHIVHALLTVILILICVYTYLVVGSVFNIINRKIALTNINNLNTHVAHLEDQYIQQVSKINFDTIFAMGFQKVEHHNFAPRKDMAASLSFLFER